MLNINQKLVVDCLRNNPLSKLPDLMSKTGLSKHNVRQVVAEGFIDVSYGRNKAIEYTLNEEKLKEFNTNYKIKVEHDDLMKHFFSNHFQSIGAAI